MTTVHVGIRADGTPEMGVGHIVRCLALAEELIDRDVRVTVVGTVTVAWVREALSRMPVALVAPPATVDGLVALGESLGLDALVLDGYELDPATGAAARAAGLVVLAVHDGAFGADQDADIYLDQNYGARPNPRATGGRASLTGLDHALFRASVLDIAGEPRPRHNPPRVLAVFGGTDPHGAVTTLAPLVLATGHPVELVCVVTRPGLDAELATLPLGPGQTLRRILPTPDVPQLAAASTLTVSAAGSSIWELFHLGVPTAIVAVADNQDTAYAAVTGLGAAAPGGRLTQLRASQDERNHTQHVLARLLEDAAYRDELSGRARLLVDGRGRGRVADTLLGAVADHAAR